MQHNLGDKATNLVWIDLEMTGLDVDNDTIIEIATIITDKDLNILAEGPVIPIKTDANKLDSMSEFVRNMHTVNGLIDRVKASEVTLEQAEQQTLEFIQQWTEVNQAPLCGNSISSDKMFLNKYMPKIIEHLHYRIIDVSSIKELNKLWGIAPIYEKNSTHLAIDDIRESISELRYYKTQVFKTFK